MAKRNYRNSKMYPYSYIYNGAKTILIWQTRDEGDSFRLDRRKRLIAASSEKRLKELLGTEARKVQWSEGAEINLDAFWRSVSNLKADRASSQKTCELLLAGWNFIEDLLRTFGLHQEMQRLRSPLLGKVYNKLFYANNLPSITPEGKSYEPIWSRGEILSLRNAFREIWKSLETKTGVGKGVGFGRRGR